MTLLSPLLVFDSIYYEYQRLQPAYKWVTPSIISPAYMYSKNFRVPIEDVLAIIQSESEGQQYAVSYANARGFMQVMPLHYSGNANDLFDPHTNIYHGVYVYRWCLNYCKGNKFNAIRCYNAGHTVPESRYRNHSYRNTILYNTKRTKKLINKAYIMNLEQLSKESPYIFVFGFILLVAFTSIGFLTLNGLKIYARKEYFQAKLWWEDFLNRRQLILLLKKEITNKFHSHGIEIVFQTFRHFYETQFKDMEHWEFDREYFPNGKTDLVRLYQWVTKIRPDNYKEFEKLQFDDKSFKYWGSTYEGFRYKLESDGTLKITPIEYIESENKEAVFDANKLKLQNLLYNFDSSMCQWIIERRKFLMI